MKGSLKFTVLALGAFSFVAIAAAVSINASRAPYSSVAAAQGLSVNSMTELRTAGLLGLAGMYRAVNGVSSLPVGSTINVTWGDGSKEIGQVVCLVGSPCVQPVPGTQRGGGGGGGGSGNAGGNYGGGGGCVASCGGGVGGADDPNVDVGEPERVAV